MERGGLRARLKLNSPDDVETKSSGEIRPSRVMGHKSAVRQPLDAVGELFAQAVQLLQEGGLILSEQGGMTRSRLDESFGNVPQHDGGIFRIQPNVRVGACLRPVGCRTRTMMIGTITN